MHSNVTVTNMLARLISETKSCSQKVSKGNRFKHVASEMNMFDRISEQLLHSRLFYCMNLDCVTF